MAKKKNGLGMIKINHFLRSVRMSWLRRFTFSNSTWANLYKKVTKPYTFVPITYKLDDLKRA